jgi:hypothetical protein
MVYLDPAKNMSQVNGTALLLLLVPPLRRLDFYRAAARLRYTPTSLNQLRRFVTEKREVGVGKQRTN